MSDNAAPVVMWSADREGGGDVCLCIGVGTAAFEVWLEPEAAIELGETLRRLGLEAKPTNVVVTFTGPRREGE